MGALVPTGVHENKNRCELGHSGSQHPSSNLGAVSGVGTLGWAETPTGKSQSGCRPVRLGHHVQWYQDWGPAMSDRATVPTGSHNIQGSEKA